jgi:hypothetical protein
MKHARGWLPVLVVALMAPRCAPLAPPSMSPLAGPMPRLERMANYVATGGPRPAAAAARATTANTARAAVLSRPEPFSMNLQGIPVANLPKKCEWAPGEPEPACDGVRMYDLILHTSSRYVCAQRVRSSETQVRGEPIAGWTIRQRPGECCGMPSVTTGLARGVVVTAAFGKPTTAASRDLSVRSRAQACANRCVRWRNNTRLNRCISMSSACTRIRA